MALRLLEIVVPDKHFSEVLAIIEENEISEYWQTCSCEQNVIFKVILQAEKTESLMDQFETRYKHLKDFHLILQPLEASFPSPKEIELKEEEKNGNNTANEKVPLRVSRQELYNDIFDNSKLTSVFLVMVILSAIVAAVGLLRNNVAVIIGAMVIAPLLGPNVALSLATTLGDEKLGRNAVKSNFSGVLLGFILSCLIGLFINSDLTQPEILSRTVVSFGDIVLALAAGVAGALAYTTGVPSTLIGVMVAVALVPPLVTSGLLIGSGSILKGLGALLLVLVNMICINLAGVITFLVQGIRPKSWWEASRAKKATQKAVVLWTVLLAALILLLSVRYMN